MHQENLLELMIGTAREQPELFAVEDIHWADPSTLAETCRVPAVDIWVSARVPN